MLTKEQLPHLDLDAELIKAVQSRIDNGQYSDAILTAFRYLTDVIREKSGEGGDGAALVGKALGGAAPPIRLSELRTVSQQDEQKGLEQLVRGLYIGIRNPRTHDSFQDTEDYCLRVLIIIDTVLQYVRREVEAFDVVSFADRVLDRFFVPSNEYADSLVSQVPDNKLYEVFAEIFNRRDEGDNTRTRYAFEALYRRMSKDALVEAAEKMAHVLRTESDTAKITAIFGIMRPDQWTYLPGDVRLRMEHLIVEDCRRGRYDVYGGGSQFGAIGSWGSKFAMHFTSKEALSATLLELLHRNWYTQNYVGAYYLYTLPDIATDPDTIKKIAEALAYALLTNQALVLRQKFNETCHNYPQNWKEALRVAIQARNDHDPVYAASVMSKLTQ
jgi:uncharacterized protein (TIGR02391 family)